MAEKQNLKSERTPHKKVIKLAPAIGDWTTYHPVKNLTKKIRAGLYGFDRLSAQTFDQAIRIHYLFITKLLAFFKTEIKLGSELHTISGEQSDYLHFLKNSSAPVVQIKVSIPGAVDSAILLIDLALANSIINYALGSRDTEVASRGLTLLENEILASTLKKAIPFYVEVFEGAFDHADFSIVSSPEITVDSAINPSNSFMVFSLGIAVNDNPPSPIAFGYPATLLKGLLDKTNRKGKESTLNLAKLPAAILSALEIPINVAIGETAVTTLELENLEVGDVLSLEKTLDQPIEIKIGNKIVLLGQPGKIDRKLATRVVGLRHDSVVKIHPLPKEEKPAPGMASASIIAEPEEEILPATAPVVAPPPKTKTVAPKATPTLQDKIKSIDMGEDLFLSDKPGDQNPQTIPPDVSDFSLEDEEKEAYPIENGTEEIAGEGDGSEDFDEDVLSEDETELDDYSLKDEDLSLGSFSLKDIAGNGPQKAI